MKTVILDGGTIFDAADLHNALARELALPAQYGRSLDDLYDCLCALSQDTHLFIRNWHHVEFHLKDYSGKAVYVLHCAHEENPHFTAALEP
jgi:RNAse (barnase) inhibitor barstar